MVFGPNWGESRDAHLLLHAKAGIALPAGRAEGAAELARHWKGWIGNEEERAAQGRRAAAVVAGGLGAARRSAGMLAELIGSRPPRR